MRSRLDGSGAADLVYLGADGVRLYFNESGNRWSGPETIGFPHVGERRPTSPWWICSATAPAAWCGRRRFRECAGTPAIPAAPGLQAEPDDPGYQQPGRRNDDLLRPVDGLLRRRSQRGPSLGHQVAIPGARDRPCGERQHITGNRFVTRYAYHHGHYDGLEREPRGFAIVEQWDSEEFADEGSSSPRSSSVLVHTGGPQPRDVPPDWLVAEWYGGVRYLPPPRLPADLDVIEQHQAARALRGQILRREIYSFDASPRGQTALEPGDGVRRAARARRNGGAHAVFQPVERESLSISLKRDPTDPHLTQGVNLRFDERGDVLRSATVAYGRVNANPELTPEAQEDQERTYVTVTEVEYTDDLDERAGGVHRMGVPYETRSFELTGAAAQGTVFLAEELDTAIDDAAPLDYEEDPKAGQVELRLLSKSRMTFLDDDLDPMPLGQWDTLGLLARIHTLAPPRRPSPRSTARGDRRRARGSRLRPLRGRRGLVDPVGVDLYPADAASRFYMPTGSRDPYGTETVAEHDDYDLLLERTAVTQAPWQQQTSVNDYRTLSR